MTATGQRFHQRQSLHVEFAVETLSIWCLWCVDHRIAPLPDAQGGRGQTGETGGRTASQLVQTQGRD